MLIYIYIYAHVNQHMHMRAQALCSLCILVHMRILFTALIQPVDLTGCRVRSGYGTTRSIGRRFGGMMGSRVECASNGSSARGGGSVGTSIAFGAAGAEMGEVHIMVACMQSLTS